MMLLQSLTFELWRLDQLEEVKGVFAAYSAHSYMDLSLHPCPRAILSGRLHDILLRFDKILTILKINAEIRGVKKLFRAELCTLYDQLWS